MKIEQRGNSYRVSKMVNGRRYRVSFDHKPTSAEVLRVLSKEIERESHGPKSSFGAACDNYINSKNHVLSPSTIRGYASLMKRIDPDFMKKPITQIRSGDVQALVNNYAVNHSPKSVANLSGFVMAVLLYHDIPVRSPRLPQKIKKDVYIPTVEDVSKLMAVVKDTPYETLVALSCFGLRRSEILAITPEQLDGNVLHIVHGKVEDKDGNWLIKTTKTTDSTRSIIIPEHIADLIRKNGQAFPYNPSTLTRSMRKYCEMAGVPYFSIHKLRHFLASYLHQKGYTDAQIQDYEGWKNDKVMKNVYRHAMNMDDVKISICSEVSSLFSDQ